MTHESAVTQAVELEDLAFRGFEDPESLTVEEIRLMCAAVLVQTLAERRHEKIKVASWKM